MLLRLRERRRAKFVALSSSNTMIVAHDMGSRVTMGEQHMPVDTIRREI